MRGILAFRSGLSLTKLKVRFKANALHRWTASLEAYSFQKTYWKDSFSGTVHLRGPSA